MTAVLIPSFRKDHHRSHRRIDHDLFLRREEVQECASFPEILTDDRLDKDDPVGQGLSLYRLLGLHSSILHPRRCQLASKPQEIIQSIKRANSLSAGPMHLKRPERFLLLSLRQQP